MRHSSLQNPLFSASNAENQLHVTKELLQNRKQNKPKLDYWRLIIKLPASCEICFNHEWFQITAMYVPTADSSFCKKAKRSKITWCSKLESRDNFANHLEQYRLRRCIATINRWTDYCNNREIIVSDYWLSQKHRKIIGPDGLEK